MDLERQNRQLTTDHRPLIHMEFKPKKQESSPVAGMISRLKSAEYENYSERLSRSCRQMGEFILKFCDDISEDERFKIEQFLRDLDAGRF